MMMMMMMMMDDGETTCCHKDTRINGRRSEKGKGKPGPQARVKRLLLLPPSSWGRGS